MPFLLIEHGPGGPYQAFCQLIDTFRLVRWPNGLSAFSDSLSANEDSIFVMPFLTLCFGGGHF